MATLYDTLGVREDATVDEIKAAYRKAVMKWHPDRNVGREEQARAAFLEIKEAYTILSDPLQRKVYDAVYADEMRRHGRQQEQEKRAKAEREAQAQHAADASYAELVKVAMRFAEDGHNRDVLFGVLLGRDCDVPLATRIANSVWALHESRKAPAPAPAPANFAEAETRAEEPAAASAAQSASAAEPEPPKNETADETADAAADKQADEPSTQDQRHAGVFNSLWHSFFGIRS
ncbi:J domain-containing protein [Trinickia violacea]|uniref:J domain-containing protein n=1 Tax=Trinickia violacea TaxID=2571746 RepID=A0A4P8IVE9_9BURK|nr:DnaJ domain-containing protein [Trinickia violacea]QCP52401.1 J domain-containing protein [Trinickia violacea]